MKIYDTLIIGSCYRALGYAITRGETVIVEERELCDTQLCLPLYSFKREEKEPTTELGASLKRHFDELRLYEGNMQNTAAIEMGFCRFASEYNTEIFLKCRVVSATLCDGYYDVRTVSGEGTVHLFAKQIIDMRADGKERSITMLVTAENGIGLAELESTFENSLIEPAFYNGRYAIHVPVGEEENIRSATERVYSEFIKKVQNAKLIHVAHAISASHSDRDFGGPIGALEDGIRLAGEGKI